MTEYEGQLLSDDIIEALKLDGRWIEEDGDGDETSEERIARVKAWLESTREDWLARVERARLSWPDDFEGGVLCGPVED